MSPRPRSRGKDEQILDAAVALFAERGVDAVGVAEIARRAGVGLGTLYLRFCGKEEVAEAAYVRCKRAWARAVLDDWPAGASPAEQFRAYWTRLGEFARDKPDHARYLERHPPGAFTGPGTVALRADLDRRARRVVAAWTGPGVGSGPDGGSGGTAADGGDVPACGAGLPIEVVTALVHGTFWRIAELPVPAERRDELLIAARDAVWRALRGSGPEPATRDTAGHANG